MHVDIVFQKKKRKIESEIPDLAAPTLVSMGFTHLSKPISGSAHGEQNLSTYLYAVSI